MRALAHFARVAGGLVTSGVELAESRPPASVQWEQMDGRLCSKVACTNEATQTFTYVYADSMAVLGPLSDRHEPHSYDLCPVHAERLSAPRGWQVIRHVALNNEL